MWVLRFLLTNPLFRSAISKRLKSVGRGTSNSSIQSAYPHDKRRIQDTTHKCLSSSACSRGQGTTSARNHTQRLPGLRRIDGEGENRQLTPKREGERGISYFKRESKRSKDQRPKQRAQRSLQHQEVIPHNNTNGARGEGRRERN